MSFAGAANEHSVRSRSTMEHRYVGRLTLHYLLARGLIRDYFSGRITNSSARRSNDLWPPGPGGMNDVRALQKCRIDLSTQCQRNDYNSVTHAVQLEPKRRLLK
jgi:hypothetical protein